MSARALQGTVAPWVGLVAGVATIAAGIFAGASIMLGVDPKLTVAALAGAAMAVAILRNVEWGLYALAGFAILRLSDIATDYHGAPSTVQPLLGLIVLSIVAR
ncbi:hypothetical protein HQ535_03135 [bacterium]|nr:hypothetical protein [bacterium]